LAELFVGLMVLGYLYFLTTRQRREESEDEVMRGPFEIVADELGTVK
jgi:hypothetical protein